MGRVVEWAVVVRTVARDARVVAVQARLHERGEIAVVRQYFEERLGGLSRPTHRRLRERVEERPFGDDIRYVIGAPLAPRAS